MKKLTLVFICIFIFMLAGCQAQLDSSNSKVDSSQTTPDSTSDSGSTSEGDPMNTDTGTDQADEKGGAATLDEQAGERELKNAGSLHGEIEVTHKLSLGKTELSEGETVLFHIEIKSADSELKITLTGSETGTTLEGSVTGTGDISFEINTADEYTVVLENCSLRGVQFTIDYSIGGSK